MVTRITKSQLNDILNEKDLNEDILPTNNMRTLDINNKSYLIIDVKKNLNKTYITSIDIINLIEEYNKQKYVFMFFSYPFLVVYKKHTFFYRVKKYFSKT